MTASFRVRFDGKVLVPEVPVDLPLHERLVVAITRDQAAGEPAHGTVAFLKARFKGRGVSDEDVELMRAAIEDACERIDSEPAIDFDKSPDRHEHRD